MLYLSAFLFTFVISALNVSLLPHFWPFSSQITFVLPFLAIYSLKDKTIFPYLLAVVLGLFYDSLTVASFPFFSVAFLIMTMIGKNFFSKITSYGVERTGWLLTLIGYLIILVSGWERVAVSYTNISLYTGVALNLVSLFVFQLLIFRLLVKYFDWVEKTTSERFR